MPQTSANPMMESCKALQQLATLLAVLSVAALALNESRGQQTSIAECSCLLAGSLVAAIFAAMSSAMVAFFSEGRLHVPSKALAVLWVPIALVNLSVGEFLGAGFVWYSSRYRGSDYFRIVAMQLVALAAGTIILAAWIWRPWGWQLSHSRVSAKKR